MENRTVVRRTAMEVRRARKLKQIWCVHIFPIFRLQSPCIPNATTGNFFMGGGAEILIFSCFSGQSGFAIYPVLML